MIAVFILFLVLGIVLAAGGVLTYRSAEEALGAMLAILGILILTLNITLFSVHNNNKAKVEALVESGKYEIVTHDDYSLNELKQFTCIGGVYLKEINEEERK